MNLRLNPPRAAQAVRTPHPAYRVPPAIRVGFCRRALAQVVCWLAVGLWFAAIGALLFAVGSG